MNRRTSAWVATHAPAGTRWGTKTLSLLLSLVLCLTLLPTAVFAEGDGNTDTGKAIQLDTGSITGGQASSVYFGNYQQSSNDDGSYNTDPIKWRVLSNANKNLFLLSDRNLDVLKYHTDRTGVSWETSSLRNWLNATFWGAAFSSQEKTAVADTSVLNKDHHGTSAGNDTTDKIFLLSIEEGSNTDYGFSSNASQTGESTGRVSLNTAYAKSKLTNQSSDDWPFDRNDAGDWWLRSPGSGSFYASLVSESGYLNYSGYDVDSNNIAVRPAFNLNLNSVLFTSAAEGGKADTAVGENLTAVTDYTGSEWKLTLKDSSRSFSANVNGQTSASAPAGGSVQITYTGAQTDENEYVSVLLCDGNDNVLYYGTIAQSSESGTASVTIPADLAVGDYTLKVFSELCSGDKKTDYASDFQNISLTVTSEAYITIVDADGNEVSITPSNCDDVLGNGTVSYTPPSVDSARTYTANEIGNAMLGESVEGIQPAVLTLKNANLKQIRINRLKGSFGDDSVAGITKELLQFPTVKLEGENSITNSDENSAGIVVDDGMGMIISGDGRLTVHANGQGSKAIHYNDNGLYLQQSGTVKLNADTSGIFQGEPIHILFWGGKLTIQAGKPEDKFSGAITNFQGLSVADNATLWLGDSADENRIRIAPPTDGETWQNVISAQWNAVGSENKKPHYLQLTSAYSVTLNANDGTIADGEDVTSYTYGVGAALPTPSRPGYRFDGWYAEADFSGDAVTGISATANGDKTFYAKWTRISSGGSSSRPSYTVSVDKTEHGSVTVSPRYAEKGDTVTITVTPDKGYTLEALTVLDKNGNKVKLTEKNGKYTFTMPASKVTVKATFMDDNTMLNYFVDVKSSDYYYDAVLWAAQNGITSGTDAVHFSPNNACTRAQIVTFLWRAAGSPVVNYAMNMTDVPADAYYAEAVRWALSEGITTGTTATTFSPDETCTRAQAVAFLFRYAAPEAVTLQELVSGFSDAASVPGYALSAMNWALAEDVVQGDGKNLMPNDSCTRAQIVTFLYRALEK